MQDGPKIIPKYINLLKIETGQFYKTWHGHVMRRDESHIPKRVISMNRHPSKGRI
jgi:hypothetical protein